MALSVTRPEEALPVLEANLALLRRYWPNHKSCGFRVQTNLANCLGDLGRNDEALMLRRKIYASRVAALGVSDELDDNAIVAGGNLTISMMTLNLWDEAKTLLCDQLLPAARNSLGSDHDFTLKLNHNLADALCRNPVRTRDKLRLNQRRFGATSTFDLNTGNDLLKAEAILQDVVQRRRRVFGSAHPDTRGSETLLRALSLMRERLA